VLSQMIKMFFGYTRYNSLIQNLSELNLTSFQIKSNLFESGNETRSICSLHKQLNMKDGQTDRQTDVYKEDTS